MSNLHMVSWTKGGGKTALCAGIGIHLRSNGKRVGYLKPVVLAMEGVSPDIDKDARFMQQALELNGPLEALCPFNLTPQELMAELDREGLSDKLVQIGKGISKDKDIVLLEGFGDLGEKEELLHASCRMADILDTRVIMVVSYFSALPWEKIVSSCERFAQHLLGIVINKVPRKEIESVDTEVTPLLSKKGVKVLGVLPEERMLLGISVAELAEDLQAEVLCCNETINELVENLMIGALSVDSGEDYFARKANKAVVTRGERPDIQLAALATSTKCLVLSGGKPPSSQVLHWAEDKGVPILLVKQDVLSIATELEKSFHNARFRQQGKLEGLGQILAQCFNYQALYGDLGVAS